MVNGIFDLPTDTKKERKAATVFRQNLIKDSFTMFQFSIYIRHCGSKENMGVHIKRVSSFIPTYGKVGIMGITDKQFEEIKLFYGQKPQRPNAPGAQLELF
nr:CRISPR-associated endonuclease Cas2 [Prevotella nigrescens]